MRSKSEFVDLVEERRVKSQESYEEEFGGNAKVITVFSKANTVVTFYISVRGEYRHFEDALRFTIDQDLTLKNYAVSYAGTHHKEIKDREWRTKK